MSEGEAVGTETMPQVEEAFEEIEVDAPLVGIIMGSKNDKPKLQPTGEALQDSGIRYEVRVVRGPRRRGASAAPLARSGARRGEGSACLPATGSPGRRR